MPAHRKHSRLPSRFLPPATHHSPIACRSPTLSPPAPLLYFCLLLLLTRMKSSQRNSRAAHPKKRLSIGARAGPLSRLCIPMARIPRICPTQARPNAELHCRDVLRKRICFMEFITVELITIGSWPGGSEYNFWSFCLSLYWLLARPSCAAYVLAAICENLL